MAIIMQLFAKQSCAPRIVLFDPRDTGAAALSKFLTPKLPLVHIYHGEFGDLAQDTDALVVPTNSVGAMPKEYIDYFGDPALELRLKSVICRRYSGKLLLGQSVLLATRNQLFPYIICAPCTRPDGSRGNEPTNAYVATRAVMDLWRFSRFQRRIVRRLVSSIAMPVLAPDSGTFSLDVVAKEQLRALEENYTAYAEARRRHPHLFLVPDAHKA